MRTIILTAIISLSVATVSGQSKQLPSQKKEILKLLCHKWVLTSMSGNGKKASIPSNESSYVTYNSDGRFTDSSARFEVLHGTWTYDHSTHYLHTKEEGGNSKIRITKLTSSELVMEVEYPTTTMIAYYKRYDLK